MKKLIFLSLLFTNLLLVSKAHAQKRSLVSSEEVTYIDGAKVHVTCDLYNDGSFEGRVSINHNGCPNIIVKWKFFDNDSEYLSHVADHIEEGSYSTCQKSRNFFKRTEISTSLANKIDNISIEIKSK